MPGKPDPPILRDPTGRTLQVAWSPPENTGPRISGYDLDYRREGSSTYHLRNFYRSTRSATITGLSLNTPYEVRVRAKNADGPGPWSKFSRETTLESALVPGRVSQPVATASSGIAIRVGWGAPGNTGPRISGYDVEYRKLGSGYARKSFGRTARSATITGLESDTTYEVRVRAKNADGAGPWSRVVQVKTPKLPPGKPAAPEVLPGGWGSVRMTWNAPRNSGPSISDYDVQYRKEGSTDAFRDAGFNGTNRETTISRLINGTSSDFLTWCADRRPR